MATKNPGGGIAPQEPAQPAAANVRWNTQGLTRSYANFDNATSTRDGILAKLIGECESRCGELE